LSRDPTDPTDLTDLTDQGRWALYAPWLEHGDPAVRANALICLVHQANFLLDQQIEALERQFVEGGGYSEQLATARLAERNKRRESRRDPSDRSDPTDPSDLPEQIPDCPHCGSAMVLRTAKTGQNAGSQFWGCSGYPDCTGVVNLHGLFLWRGERVVFLSRS